jgi:high-affinity Fe2+/Pb2+ permease
MDPVNGFMATIGGLLLIVASLLVWVTLLLHRNEQLEREVAQRRRWWERSQRQRSRD